MTARTSDLWLRHDLGRPARHGRLLYSARPEGLWAVHRLETTFGSDLVAESAELLGTYGSLAHGVGHLLLQDGVALPPELTGWATAPTVPLTEVGGWVPTLGSIDGAAQLMVTRRFDGLNMAMTTWSGGHWTFVTPSSCAFPDVARRDDLDG